MTRIEYVKNRQLKEKEINFNDAIDIIFLELNNSIKTVKTIFEVPSTKGIGFHQITKWNKDSISCEWFNNNFVITDDKNSLSISKDANFTIRNRKNIQGTFELFFKDYNMFFIIE